MSTNGMPLEGAGVEKQLFRQVCGRFACGITVITVKDEAGAVHGMTANSFTSVSLNPPLVLVCIDHRAKVLQHFRHSTHFGINVLSEHQRALSERFAGTGYDRFAGVDWHPGQTGVPLITGVLGALECTRVKLVAAGDHDILIGRVVHAQCHEGEPLIYFASQYRRLSK
ncbi:MAG TPA: flavin reductase family protein [Bryobacteraceae bacterium]|jgi:flavin reductase (DIM6/NTAB) family NADH-FMN oxidoreductase RutF|nr:flavin reductase family protein [Bryobacteraceae bacterium]